MVFRMDKKLDRSFFRFVTVHAFDRRTDGRTDGQTDGQLSHRYTASAFHLARKNEESILSLGGS